MKILFYNMRRLPPLGVGGDTVSLGALLDFLSRNNFQCSALGNFNHPGYIKLKDNPIKRLKKNKIDYYFKISFSKSDLMCKVCKVELCTLCLISLLIFFTVFLPWKANKRNRKRKRSLSVSKIGCFCIPLL